MKNKLKTALLAIKTGMPIEEASRSVDWKDFEGLVAEILESKNFEVVRNFRMKKPTMEIDCLLYTSPSPRDRSLSRMPSSA